MENHIFSGLADDAARLLAMQALGVQPTCRKCGAPLSGRSAASFLAGKRVKCSLTFECDWYGTWRDHTPLHRSTLNDRQFLALFYRFTLPAAQSGIAEALGISPATVREWRGRIAEIFPRDAAA